MLRCISISDSRGASACTRYKSCRWGGSGGESGSWRRCRPIEDNSALHSVHTALMGLFSPSQTALDELVCSGASVDTTQELSVCQTGTTLLPPMGQSQTASPAFKLCCLYKRDVSSVLPNTGPVREYRTNEDNEPLSLSLRTSFPSCLLSLSVTSQLQRPDGRGHSALFLPVNFCQRSWLRKKRERGMRTGTELSQKPSLQPNYWAWWPILYGFDRPSSITWQVVQR